MADEIKVMLECIVPRLIKNIIEDMGESEKEALPCSTLQSSTIGLPVRKPSCGI